MRQVVLDTETTGLEIEGGHRILEIGCVEIVGRKLTKRHYHQYINPDRDSDDGALEVHGITREFPIEYMYRSVRPFMVTEGTNEIQKLAIGRSLTGIEAF